jgi:hypothetical protein
MNTSRFLSFLLIGILFSGCYSSDDISPAAESSGDTGIAGSYARFMIVGNFMYVVDVEAIKTFNISNPADPVQVDEKFIGSNIETIFNLRDRLFIGSGSGLYIYTIGADGIPQEAGEFLYDQFNWGFEPCDPVVANDSLAFVTLNTTNRVERCRIVTNQPINVLNIFDITDVYDPVLLTTYELFNPKGVGLDGNLLFICEDTQGLKVFDVSDIYNLELIAHFDTFTAFDVIPLNGLLLVVGPDNVYQFDYTDPSGITLISQIPIGI